MRATNERRELDLGDRVAQQLSERRHAGSELVESDAEPIAGELAQHDGDLRITWVECLVGDLETRNPRFEVSRCELDVQGVTEVVVAELATSDVDAHRRGSGIRRRCGAIRRSDRTPRR